MLPVSCYPLGRTCFELRSAPWNSGYVFLFCFVFAQTCCYRFFVFFSSLEVRGMRWCVAHWKDGKICRQLKAEQLYAENVKLQDCYAVKEFLSVNYGTISYKD